MNIDKIMEQTDELIPFLRKLADSLEKKELAPQQLKSICDFFMSYQFQEQAFKDFDDSGNDGEVTFSQQDLIKFVSLGWYVYQFLLKETSLNNGLEEND